MNYKKAGVNIDAGNKLVKALGAVVEQTARPGADTQLGSFGSIFDLKSLSYKDPLLISGTDGVGTKLKLAVQLDTHDTIGQDLVAMCVNDIICQGAEPLFFLDYLSTSKLDPDKAATIIAGIANGCKQSNCALIGGETAEMPSMYQKSQYDMAGFAVGIVERDQLLPKKDEVKAGDMIIGIASSGAHSNGFSLIRKIIDDNNISLTAPPPFPSPYQTLGELLLEPTTTYTNAVLPLNKKNLIKGAAHITGGGLLENIPRILPEKLSAQLDNTCWNMPPLFDWLQATGEVEREEMYRVFNMGIGMVLLASPKYRDKIMSELNNRMYLAYDIGTVIDRTNRPVTLI